MELDTPGAEAIARKVIGDPTARLLSWSVERLGAGASEQLGKSDGLLRAVGETTGARGIERWSTVGKTMRNTPFEVGGFRPDIEDPHGVEYWRREADAYASGTLESIGDGLTAARVFQIDELGDEVVIWMEEVVAEDDAPWPLDRYWLAARHIGQFSGYFADRVPESARPWASRGRLLEWVQVGARGIEKMRTIPRSGLTQSWLSDRSVERIERLYRHRERLMTLLETLPQTLCHHDAHRRNLMSVRQDNEQQTVAIDWAMAGTGYLGEDLAVLAGVSLQLLDVPMADHVEFEAAVIDGYVAGLRAAGWSGNETTLRSGYKAALSLLMGVGAAGIWFATVSEPDNGAFAERLIGRSNLEIGEQWAQLQPYLLDLGEEALLSAPA